MQISFFIEITSRLCH